MPHNYSFQHMQNRMTLAMPGMIVSKGSRLMQEHYSLLKLPQISQVCSEHFLEKNEHTVFCRNQTLCNLGEDFLSHIVLTCKNERIAKVPPAPKFEFYTALLMPTMFIFHLSLFLFPSSLPPSLLSFFFSFFLPIGLAFHFLYLHSH